MPELPEVEVVRRGLEPWVTGRTIAGVEVLHPRAARRHLGGPDDLIGRLRGATFATPQRRGKYLWIPLAPNLRSGKRTEEIDPDRNSEALVVHLGMSGQVLVQPTGTPDEVHLRARFTFDDDGPEVRFVDQRTFGGIAVDPLMGDTEPVPASVAHIARDPFDPALDRAGFARALRRRRTGLKRALLDQTLVSGIGNIYADEALWRARLHYARATDGITTAEALRVLDAAAEVMAEALAQGGTSFDELYVDVDGFSGYFERSLAVYGRTGQPCPRCGTEIRRETFMNRSSHLCPTCQRKPRRPR